MWILFWEKAAKLYMQAGQWDKARQISANFGPPFQQVG